MNASHKYNLNNDSDIQRFIEEVRLYRGKRIVVQITEIDIEKNQDLTGIDMAKTSEKSLAQDWLSPEEEDWEKMYPDYAK